MARLTVGLLRPYRSARTGSDGSVDPGGYSPDVMALRSRSASCRVVKAYRQLEHDGLAGGRPGQGTFITGSLSPDPPESHRTLRASLERWLRDADAAGLSDEAVSALIAVARHDMKKENV